MALGKLFGVNIRPGSTFFAWLAQNKNARLKPGVLQQS